MLMHDLQRKICFKRLVMEAVLDLVGLGSPTATEFKQMRVSLTTSLTMKSEALRSFLTRQGLCLSSSKRPWLVGIQLGHSIIAWSYERREQDQHGGIHEI